jgi:hypothetical protein
MGERQPDMQRYQTGLGAGADQRQHQHHGGDRLRRWGPPHRLELVAAGSTGEQAECE